MMVKCDDIIIFIWNQLGELDIQNLFEALWSIIHSA